MSEPISYLHTPGAPKQFRAPNRSSIIAMRLFVFSLGILFFASMLAYGAIRTGFFGKRQLRLPDGSIQTLAVLEFGALRPALPAALWISTVLVIAASFTISRSLAAVRRERQRPFRAWLAATLILAVLFVIMQAPSLGSILSEHFTRNRSGQTPVALVGAMFFLIVVHALHVVGGIITLAWVMYRAGQNTYDHEHHMAIRHAAFYWHFLDGVWLVMFGTLLVLG